MSWMTILDLGVKIIAWFLGRSQKTEQQKKDFLAFVKKYKDRKNSSVNQQDDVNKQLEDISKPKE